MNPSSPELTWLDYGSDRGVAHAYLSGFSRNWRLTGYSSERERVSHAVPIRCLLGPQFPSRPNPEGFLESYFPSRQISGKSVSSRFFFAATGKSTRLVRFLSWATGEIFVPSRLYEESTRAIPSRSFSRFPVPVPFSRDACGVSPFYFTRPHVTGTLRAVKSHGT